MKSSTQLFLVLLAIVKLAECGEYVKKDGRTYYISYPQIYNWYESYRYCTALGMFLVDMRTEAEANRTVEVVKAFHNKMNPHVRAYWTSGTDLGWEGNFYWMTTGQSLVYRNWYSGQPNNLAWGGETENCLAIDANDYYQWHDGLCSSKFILICRSTMDVTNYKSNGCSIETNSFV